MLWAHSYSSCCLALSFKCLSYPMACSLQKLSIFYEWWSVRIRILSKASFSLVSMSFSPGSSFSRSQFFMSFSLTSSLITRWLTLLDTGLAAIGVRVVKAAVEAVFWVDLSKAQRVVANSFYFVYLFSWTSISKGSTSVSKLACVCVLKKYVALKPSAVVDLPHFLLFWMILIRRSFTI